MCLWSWIPKISLEHRLTISLSVYATFVYNRASLVAQRLKHLPGMLETRVRSLGRIPWRRKMATHSSTLAWRIPWREEPGRLQSMGPQRVRHDWATSFIHSCTYKSVHWWISMCKDIHWYSLRTIWHWREANSESVQGQKWIPKNSIPGTLYFLLPRLLSAPPNPPHAPCFPTLRSLEAPPGRLLATLTGCGAVNQSHPDGVTVGTPGTVFHILSLGKGRHQVRLMTWLGGWWPYQDMWLLGQ